MDYHGQRSQQADRAAIYRSYLDTTAEFIAWLTDRDCTVRIVYGDKVYDTQPRHDLCALLHQKGIEYSDHGIIDEDIESVDQLVSVLARSAMVISPRFHNQLIALMLHKPVISISYDPKSDFLMKSMGMGDYCQPIEELDLGKLMKQFLELEEKFPKMTKSLESQISKHKDLLKGQYERLLE